MIKLDYPTKRPSIKTEQGKEFVFCMTRRRWVILTPEEWVRQNFLLYLTEILNYPASLIAVERQLVFAELKKRFDIVVFNRDGEPQMIIECKEMNVPLTAQAINQVVRYNTVLQAATVVVTNGSYCAAFQKNGVALEAIPQFPK